VFDCGNTNSSGIKSAHRGEGPIFLKTFFAKQFWNFVSNFLGDFFFVVSFWFGLFGLGVVWCGGWVGGLTRAKPGIIALVKI
jgi:hypothetical protein